MHLLAGIPACTGMMSQVSRSPYQLYISYTPASAAAAT
jgi:hypothetical protein